MIMQVLSMLCLLFCNCNMLYGIGSDVLVGRFSTQQTIVNGDSIFGFAALEAGFIFQSSGTSATFSSFFPVSGNVDIRGGTLILACDLKLSNPSTVARLGNITGNNHLFELSSTSTLFPTTLLSPNNWTFSNLMMRLNNDTTVNGSTITYTGNCVIDGNGSNTLLLGASSNIIVGSNSTLTIRDAIIDGVTGTNLRNTDSTGTIIFDNVVINITGTYTFSTGAFMVANNVVIDGGQTSSVFTYQSTSTSTILAESRLTVNRWSTFFYSPSTPAPRLLSFFDSSSMFVLKGGTLKVYSSGMSLIKGTCLICDDSEFMSTATSVAGAIKCGDGVTSSNNFTVNFLPGANIDLTSGYLSMSNV